MTGDWIITNRLKNFSFCTPVNLAFPNSIFLTLRLKKNWYLLLDICFVASFTRTFMAICRLSNTIYRRKMKNYLFVLLVYYLSICLINKQWRVFSYFFQEISYCETSWLKWFLLLESRRSKTLMLALRTTRVFLYLEANTTQCSLRYSYAIVFLQLLPPTLTDNDNANSFA